MLKIPIREPKQLVRQVSLDGLASVCFVRYGKFQVW